MKPCQVHVWHVFCGLALRQRHECSFPRRNGTGWASRLFRLASRHVPCASSKEESRFRCSAACAATELEPCVWDGPGSDMAQTLRPLHSEDFRCENCSHFHDPYLKVFPPKARTSPFQGGGSSLGIKSRSRQILPTPWSLPIFSSDSELTGRQDHPHEGPTSDFESP